MATRTGDSGQARTGSTSGAKSLRPGTRRTDGGTSYLPYPHGKLPGLKPGRKASASQSRAQGVRPVPRRLGQNISMSHGAHGPHSGSPGAVRHEPHVKAFFDKLVARGKTPLQAYVAVMRKLLHDLRDAHPHHPLRRGDVSCCRLTTERVSNEHRVPTHAAHRTHTCTARSMSASRR
jgi:hypothetical protein